MYCKYCGKEVKDEAVVCISCGCSIEKETKQPVNAENNESKTGLGVLFALILGLIGLLIGLIMYPDNTVARKTFIKGWAITFGVSTAAIVLFYVFIFVFAYFA